MAAINGQGGSIQVSSATYPVENWSLTISNEIIDVTDTGSAGWVAKIAGVNGGQLQFRAFWGSSVAMLSTTFAVGTSVTATPSIGGSGDSFTFPGIVSSFTINNPAKGAVDFSCTLDSNGAITYPTA